MYSKQDSLRQAKKALSIQKALEDLPNYFYGKGVELVDKSAMQAVYFAFGIAQGLDAAFSSKFGESSANVQISLKNSKEFKEWHRGVEDYIDDILRGTRHHLKKFASVIKAVTGNESLANHIKILQSFDYFKDRTDITAQMEKQDFTSRGLSEISKLLDNARSAEARRDAKHRNPMASKGTGDGMKGRSGGFGDNSSINDCTVYIEDMDKSGFLPDLDRSKSLRSIGDDRMVPNLRARSSRSIDQAARPRKIDGDPVTKVALASGPAKGVGLQRGRDKSPSKDSEIIDAGSSNQMRGDKPGSKAIKSSNNRPLSSNSNTKTQSEVKIEPHMIRLDNDIATVKKPLGPADVPPINLSKNPVREAQSQDSTSRDPATPLAPVRVAPKEATKDIKVETFKYQLPKRMDQNTSKTAEPVTKTSSAIPVQPPKPTQPTTTTSADVKIPAIPVQTQGAAPIPKPPQVAPAAVVEPTKLTQGQNAPPPVQNQVQQPAQPKVPNPEPQRQPQAQPNPQQAVVAPPQPVPTNAPKPVDNLAQASDSKAKPAESVPRSAEPAPKPATTPSNIKPPESNPKPADPVTKPTETAPKHIEPTTSAIKPAENPTKPTESSKPVVPPIQPPQATQPTPPLQTPQQAKSDPQTTTTAPTQPVKPPATNTLPAATTTTNPPIATPTTTANPSAPTQPPQSTPQPPQTTLPPQAPQQQATPNTNNPAAIKANNDQPRAQSPPKQTDSPKRKDTGGNAPANTPVNEKDPLKDSSEIRNPIMKGDPRASMSELTVRSGPKGKDPTIYPHIIQQESSS